MRIFVVFTGGTIGSCVGNDSMNLDDSAKYTLLKHFEYLKPEVEFEVSAPYGILSENLSGFELNLLQNTLGEALGRDYDGIIVTHGTDTIQYTSTAMEYAFCNANIPIVFVSAQYPLENPKSNGYANFEAAVELVRSNKAQGVFVSYRNEGDSFVNFHFPSRLLQHSECSSDLYSIDDKIFARYDKKIEIFSAPEHETSSPLGVFRYVSNPDILCIDSYPGNNFSYSLEGVKAVVLKPYHSATLDTSNKNLQAFCSRANEKGIPVFVVNVKPGISYESTKVFGELNIVSLPYGTYVSAYIKIWAAISLGQNIKEFVNRKISFEQL